MRAATTNGKVKDPVTTATAATAPTGLAASIGLSGTRQSEIEIESPGSIVEASAKATGGPGVPATGHGQIRTGKLAGLSLNRAIWVISWPILAQSFLDALLGTVDTTIAAHLGVKETDAVASAVYMMWLVNIIIMSVSVGSTALISRAIGAGNRGRANAVLGQSVTLSLLVGVASAILMALAAPFLGEPMGLDAGSARMMRLYLWPLAASIPAMVLTNVGFACLRGAGESQSPLWVMMLENAINIPLSILLSGVPIPTVLGYEVNWRGPDSLAWGIAGISVATAVARYAGTVVVMLLLFRGMPGMRLYVHRLRLHLDTMRQVVRISLPNLWESLGMWLGNFVIVLIVGRVLAKAAGHDGLIGVHQMAIRLEAFSFLPGFAMGTAAATLMGQYLGAGNPHMAWKSGVRCCLVATAIMAAFSYAFIAHPQAIVGLMTEQPLHLREASPILRIAGFVQVPFAVLLVLRNGLRGAGDTKWAMVLTWLGIYGIRVPGVFVAAWLWPEQGLRAVWAVMCAELVIRAALFAGRFLHGGWMRVKV